MVQPSLAVDILRCSECGNLAIGQDEIWCCDSSMDSVRSNGSGINQPALQEVTQTVFGMSKTELDLCLCVMEGGELTVMELAEQVDLDRSVVSRHLNHLVELGVIDKQRLIRKEGGHVYIYTPNEPDTVRRNLTRAFLVWVHEATSLLDSLTRDKVEAMVEADKPDPNWKVYRE